MAIIPWKSFSDLDRFFENDNWMFPVFSKTDLNKPAMDLYETEKEVVVELNIPGIEPEKIQISVENGMLNVKGEIEEQKEEKNKGYWRREIHKGSFERMTRLPAVVKENATEATYEKGVLKIVIPKAETKEVSKIKIKVKENK